MLNELSQAYLSEKLHYRKFRTKSTSVQNEIRFTSTENLRDRISTPEIAGPSSFSIYNNNNNNNCNDLSGDFGP